MERKEQYRNWLKFFLIVSLLFSVFYFHYYIQYWLPDRIYLTRAEEERIDFPFYLPTTLKSESAEVLVGQTESVDRSVVHITGQESYSLYGETDGVYQLDLRLFGLFSLKQIEVTVSEEQYVFPGGQHIGIYLQTEGVMVIGTASIELEGGEVREPAANIVQSGDYIIGAYGETVDSKERLSQLVAAHGTETAELLLLRNGEELLCRIQPVQDQNGVCRLGIWVRDDTHGIGTLTYLDQSGTFGALGHGISDGDTGLLVEAESGSLYEADIHAIKKGADGKPGSLSGSIQYAAQSYLGEVTENCDCGLFGQANETLADRLEAEAQPVLVAHSQDVKTGPASILCEINGKLEEYDIEIRRVNTGGKQTKNLVIEVTDLELIEETGGIVQGMSGSPILQDGKLIGAVTHVFIRNSKMGYGILIENMMAAERESDL